MRFFLGTHMPGWLADERFRGIPLFVSRRRLERKSAWPRAVMPWALDSGGFTELSMFGDWMLPARTYAETVERLAGEIGSMLWAAPQDWMCEAAVLAKTGLSVRAHIMRTVANLLELRMITSTVHFIPVLQGFALEDYLHCARLYETLGVDLSAEPVVGVGSICRRSGTVEAEKILRAIAGLGIRAHAFGAKITGLRRYGDVIASSDSLAWSFDARRKPALAGCSGHKNCANCPRFALRWRDHVLEG